MPGNTYPPSSAFFRLRSVLAAEAILGFPIHFLSSRARDESRPHGGLAQIVSSFAVFPDRKSRGSSCPKDGRRRARTNNRPRSVTWGPPGYKFLRARDVWGINFLTYRVSIVMTENRNPCPRAGHKTVYGLRRASLSLSR